MRKGLRVNFDEKLGKSSSREVVVKEVARRTKLTESAVWELLQTGWTFREDMEGYSWLKTTLFQK